MSFSLKTLPVLLVLAFAAGFASAQKLPNKQQISLRSPGNIKVDGKPDEWGGQFAAYNKSTRLFYSISNNEDNIYLVAQSSDPETIRKIITYGITFTVNSAAKKSTGALQVTQPVFKNAEDQTLITQCLKTNPAMFIADTAGVRHRLDTIVAVMNERLASQSAMVNATGEAQKNPLPDSDFSGVTTASYFASQSKYTLEIAIPAKYLAGFGNVLSYNIKVNGTPSKDVPVVVTRIVKVSSRDVPNLPQPSTFGRLPVVDDPADFWGEYTWANGR